MYLFRRLALNGLVIFFASTQNQLLVGLMVCFGATCLQQVLGVCALPCSSRTQRSLMPLRVFSWFRS